MRIPVLQHRTERLLRNVAIVMIAGFGAGCSADMTRFTDGIFTGSTSNQQRVMRAQPSNNSYAAAPIAAAPRGSAVQRSTLTPVSSAPIAAAPVAAASMEVRNQINTTRDMATSRVDNTVNAAGTQVASAATSAQGATVGAVNGAREKVLGQLPATPGQGAKPSVGNNVVAAPSAGGGYIVQTGDSLYSIAKKHNVPVEQLKKANGLSDGAIRIGQSLIIPAASSATTQVAAVSPQPVKPAGNANVQPVSTPPNAGADVKPYTPPQASAKVMEDAEKDQSAAPSSTGIQQMRWPVRGRVLASFGQREGGSVSDGIDIMVPEGTAVKAAENGVVIYAGDGLKEFGQTVLVRHDNGLVTVYGHNSQITVQRGQKVRRGEEIAKSGMSGNAKSPKLHFEVRKNSTPVNPSKYLES